MYFHICMSEAKTSSIRSQAETTIAALEEATPLQGAIKEKASDLGTRTAGIAESLGSLLKDVAALRKEYEDVEGPLGQVTETTTSQRSNISGYGDIGRQFRQAEQQLDVSGSSLESAGQIFASTEEALKTVEAQLTGVQKTLEGNTGALEQAEDYMSASVTNNNGAVEALKNWIKVAAED